MATRNAGNPSGYDEEMYNVLNRNADSINRTVSSMSGELNSDNPDLDSAVPADGALALRRIRNAARKSQDFQTVVSQVQGTSLDDLGLGYDVPSENNAILILQCKLYLEELKRRSTMSVNMSEIRGLLASMRQFNNWWKKNQRFIKSGNPQDLNSTPF